MEDSRLDTYTVSHWNEATCVRERSILTVEQEFTFDALGFVVLSQVLSLAELSACRHSSTSSDGLGNLCSEDGAVGRYVRELCGDGFRQDGHAKHVSAGAAGGHDVASLPLEGGVDTLDRAYMNLIGVEWPQRRRSFAHAGRRRLGRGPHPAVPGPVGGHRPHGLRRWQVPAGSGPILAQERAARPTASVLQPLR